MPGIGSILGAFGTAYPEYQQQQDSHQMNQQKLQQALRDMALQEQNRKAQAQALQSFGGMTGTGPQGTLTPQQIAQASQGNPDAFTMLTNAAKPTIQGGYNLAGRDLSGQYGLERSQQTGANAANVADIKGQTAQDVQKLRNTGATDVQGMRNTGATDVQGMRNTGNANVATIRNQRPTASSAASMTNTPEYKTAKSEYDQAKQDERAIERNYQMNPGAAYSDPQWMDARKRSLAAQKKMESIQSKATAEAAKAAVTTAAGGPPQIKSDDDYNKLPQGTQFLDPEGNLRTKP